MIVVAPISRAPAAAHRPIGPSAKTATVSPMRTPLLSAPEKPVDMISGHINTCSSLKPPGTGERFTMAHQNELRLAAIDGVAEFPAAHRLEAVTSSRAVL